MPLGEFFRALAGAVPDLAWPSMPSPPEGLHFRPVKVDDHARCVEIYRANESGRFPPGFEPGFRDALERPDYLRLAACIDQRVVAFGAISRAPFFRYDHAWLIFGMVDEAMHGRGIGSWLLLSRVCSLAQPVKPVRIMMTNIPATQGFYARFGFVHQGEVMLPSDATRLCSSAAVLGEDAWRKGRELMVARGYVVDGAVVPVMDMYRTGARDNGPFGSR